MYLQYRRFASPHEFEVTKTADYNFVTCIFTHMQAQAQLSSILA